MNSGACEQFYHPKVRWEGQTFVFKDGITVFPYLQIEQGLHPDPSPLNSSVEGPHPQERCAHLAPTSLASFSHSFSSLQVVLSR